MSTKTRSFKYHVWGQGYVIAIFWGVNFSDPVWGSRVGTDLKSEEVIAD